MTRSPTPIDTLTIASPCTVPWGSMSGNDSKRFCGQCRLHVHDVSRMTRAEVGELLQQTGGACCLRLWRRPDGRIITKDCNRVRRALRRRLQIVSAAAAGLLAVFGLGGCRGARIADGTPSVGGKAQPPPPATPEKPPVPGAQTWMGTPANPVPAEKPPVPGASVSIGR